jgi:assimilatory nitrate reductase catalytic subunit
MAWLPPAQALEAREALRTLMPAFAYAVCVPFGQERSGLLFRAAAYEPAEEALLTRLAALLGLDGRDALHYVDRKRGQRRSMRLESQSGERRLDAFLLAGDTRAEAWIRTLLEEQLPAQAYGRLLLAPGAKAPAALRARGRRVCTCLDVGEREIEDTLAQSSGPPEARLAQLQQKLKCGTNCGSCLPELRRLATAHCANGLAPA